MYGIVSKLIPNGVINLNKASHLFVKVRLISNQMKNKDSSSHLSVIDR